VPVLCGAVGVVAHAGFDVLLSQRHRSAPPLRNVRCELVADHVGCHVAFVMAAEHGESWWWARWDSARHEVVLRDVCAGVSESEPDDCLLPEGHVGVHSFQLPAVG